MHEWFGLMAAFLAPIPVWREQPQRPSRSLLGGWLPAVGLAGVVSVMTIPPIAIGLSAYQTEREVRERCKALGGHLALSAETRQRYYCVPH